MKPHVRDIPCFEQVANVIGAGRANIELFKVVGNKEIFAKCQRGTGINIFDDKLIDAFHWHYVPQGFDFWDKIDDGINPYEVLSDK